MATLEIIYLCKKMTFIFTFLFFNIVVMLAVYANAATKNDCQFNSTLTDREKELLGILEPLKGKVFHTQDGTYKYSVGICTDVNSSFPHVGVIQMTKDNRNIAIGYYNDSEIMGGTNWILLTYTRGETHVTQCDKADRVAVIMIICDPSVKKEELTILEERVKKDTTRCFYLFELSTSATCKKFDEGLSAGSVFFLIFFTLAGIYFLLGFLYQRLVVGAKGLEQIPNYTFWKHFGNLQADGCDYVCRCGPRQESQAYRGLDDRLGREEEERDDQLLTM